MKQEIELSDDDLKRIEELEINAESNSESEKAESIDVDLGDEEVSFTPLAD